MSQVCARKKDIRTVVMSSLLSSGSECQKWKNIKCPYLFCCFRSVHGHVLFFGLFSYLCKVPDGQEQGEYFSRSFCVHFLKSTAEEGID